MTFSSRKFLGCASELGVFDVAAADADGEIVAPATWSSRAGNGLCGNADRPFDVDNRPSCEIHSG